MSSPPLSNTPEGSEVNVDFDKDGNWDSTFGEGAAIHAPQWVRDIVVASLRIEWLVIPHSDDSTKNHIVGNAKFANGKCCGYSAARISMEVGSEKVVPSLQGSPAQDYQPGTFTVKLLSYAAKTHNSAHDLTYTCASGTTMGAILDAAISENMHHFVFLPYEVKDMGRWKGCGDFILNFWAKLLRSKLITNAAPKENAETVLSTDLMTTFRPGIDPFTTGIGKGRFINWQRVQDANVPETAYSSLAPS
ncbi:hypothetical protein M413DRAFT_28199 [Hebeloma cylindrosporum]|uniref:DUF7770 domain-containing protein n=1 Tax=Hebeloma cylindrosporum TaxID=76867 RepID=A0A0C3BX58_HEBCY|nr:hypothetical protein M413DRAFT_28199 [Hebeloma cylindrosporum h7]